LLRERSLKTQKLIATAIRIGNPASSQQAIDARDSSGGVIDSVTDREILAAYRLIAAKEGIFVEPSSGLVLPVLLNKAGKLPKDKTIVIYDRTWIKGHSIRIGICTREPVCSSGKRKSLLQKR